MKKRLLLAAASLMFSAVALTGYKVYSYATMTDQERLMFENIEALTADEDDEKTGFAAIMYISQTCYYTVNGEQKAGVPQVCEENAGYLTSCATGCISQIQSVNP